MLLLEEEGGNYHPELAAEITGEETKNYTEASNGENELSETRRDAESTKNSNITTGITGVHSIVYKAREVVIY